MKNYWAITVLASILILGTLGLSQEAFAQTTTEYILLVAVVAAHHDEGGVVNLVECTVTPDSGATTTVGGRDGDVNNGRVIKATLDRGEDLRTVTVTCMLDNDATTDPVTKEVKKKGTTVIIVSDPGVGIPSPG